MRLLPNFGYFLFNKFAVSAKLNYILSSGVSVGIQFNIGR